MKCSTVRATFMQSFSIVGGPNGLMNRSEEVVQINVLTCSEQEGFADAVLTPRSLADSLSRKLRRQSHDHDGPLAMVARADSN